MDIFTKTTVDEALVAEYFVRNQRKKEDEEWLKENGNTIKEYLKGTPKSLVGEYTVSISVPNTGKFNEENLIAYLKREASPKVLEACTKLTVNEDGLMLCVNTGLLNIDVLKKIAWEDSKGSPRLTITKRKAESNV